MQTPRDIDTVLFDIGNVLVRWDPRLLYRDAFASAADLEAFLAEVCPPSWNHEMDLGKPFAQAVAERQQLYPQHGALIARWHSGWEAMLGEENATMVGLLPRLAEAGYRLFALTNWSPETFPVARRRYPWLQHFAQIVVSGEVGLAKPDPAIFHLALRHSARTADRVLIIDDSAANTAAASALGFATITFTDADACLSGLRELGVTVDG